MRGLAATGSDRSMTIQESYCTLTRACHTTIFGSGRENDEAAFGSADGGIFVIPSNFEGSDEKGSGRGVVFVSFAVVCGFAARTTTAGCIGNEY